MYDLRPLNVKSFAPAVIGIGAIPVNKETGMLDFPTFLKEEVKAEIEKQLFNTFPALKGQKQPKK